MDSYGGFHKFEKDGKQILIYYHPTYHSDRPLFLCPRFRCKIDNCNNDEYTYGEISPLKSSPEYVHLAATSQHQMGNDQAVRPLFWCNNKGHEANGGCDICYGSYFGTDYYLNEEGKMFHKECVESPLMIKHPHHPEHPLSLYFDTNFLRFIECICCGRRAKSLVYSCTICKIYMHPTCAMQPIPFVVDQPKRHDHPLTSFPRQASLICNICGLLRQQNPTYVCLKCNFVAHNDCMFSPRIIKISRHQHRVSYISFLPPGEWSCGVCRRRINNDYGAYTCEKCGDYFVHSRCALRCDICDGEELEGVEEDDITKDLGPFESISPGVIRHFLHDKHYLRLEVSTLYDENKLCQACILPIFEGNFYSCLECGFILHESCANAPRRIQHMLHPHLLTLKAACRYPTGRFTCDGCSRICGGFVYECHIAECRFDIDVQCASLVEPFDHKGHEHHLFLALGPNEKPVCKVCQTICVKQFNCITCDFIICIKCATLPYKAKYKHDKHFLTLLWGEEVSEKDWCELCERNLGDTSTKLFYWCQDCCTTVHIECLFGSDLYLKPGQFLEIKDQVVQILAKSNISRPLCDACKKPCQSKIFSRDNRKACSWGCAGHIF